MGLFIILSEFELSLVGLKLKLHFHFIWDHELLSTVWTSLKDANFVQCSRINLLK